MAYLTGGLSFVLKGEREEVVCWVVGSKERARTRGKKNEVRKTRNEDMRLRDRQCNTVMAASCEHGR
jgi:hypothetical protein